MYAHFSVIRRIYAQNIDYVAMKYGYDSPDSFAKVFTASYRHRRAVAKFYISTGANRYMR
ncbi:MAG: hypothetical protein IJ428_04990 [Clostridia bacterium]|nr:hypothetical protein [Clostridia bacterium]